VSADEPDLKKEELPEKEEVIKKDERAKEKTPVKDVPSIPLPVLKVKPKTGTLLTLISDHWSSINDVTAFYGRLKDFVKTVLKIKKKIGVPHLATYTSFFSIIE